jgi:metacaspase-1
MSITLNKINNDYNTSLKNLITYTNKQINNANRTKMSSMTRNFFINKIQNEYNKNLNDLISKRKSLLQQIGKLIHNAFIVGINYIGTNYELYGCINDAYNMKEFVSVRGCDKILMMTDNEMVKPTKINILAGLTNLLMNTKENEIAVFYYSGHGLNVIDTNNDETDGLDEGLFSLDGKIILDDELNIIINKYLKSTSKLFIMCDCCHSGTMIDLKYNYNEDTNIVKEVDMSGNVYYISGCRDSQVSMETFIKNKSQGALTNAFMNSLNESISWKELMYGLRSKLTEQNPQLSTSKLIDINKEKCFF